MMFARTLFAVTALTVTLTLALTACVQPGPTRTTEPPTAVPPTLSPGPAEPTATATAGDVSSTELQEAILIQEPGPGSRVTSPVRVAGAADPTFEQTLGVRVLLDDGSELATAPAHIAADVGQRGPFAVEFDFAIEQPRQAVIQVFASSARDGGVTHLASTTVMLLPEGPAEVNPAEPHAETIIITQPEAGATVSGGTVHVEGVGLASFEQTLVVEVLDAMDHVVGRQPLIVNAPDLGQPGTYSADVAYEVAGAGPGRILVRDPSQMFSGDVHRASVEVTLEP